MARTDSCDGVSLICVCHLILVFYLYSLMYVVPDAEALLATLNSAVDWTRARRVGITHYLVFKRQRMGAMRYTGPLQIEKQFQVRIRGNCRPREKGQRCHLVLVRQGKYR